MPEFPLKLLKKEEPARNTMCLKFAKPAGFDFTPGQFITLIYTDMPFDDEKGNRRSMSMASSPTESTIDSTMRKSQTAFKRSLDQARPGAVLSGMGPFGKFTMPEDVNTPLVFLAGGVGITPFRSMIKFTIDKNIPRDIHLIYCNKCMAEATYLDELTNWSKEYPRFIFTPIMTDKDCIEPEWNGCVGKITSEFIKKEVGDIHKPTYMIVGPPGMVEAMDEMMRSLKIPEKQIKIEKFG